MGFRKYPVGQETGTTVPTKLYGREKEAGKLFAMVGTAPHTVKYKCYITMSPLLSMYVHKELLHKLCLSNSVRNN